jgi:hypothetical protein
MNKDISQVKTIHLHKFRATNEVMGMYKPSQISRIKNDQIKILDPKVVRYHKFEKDNLNAANLSRVKTMEAFAFKTYEKYDQRLQSVLGIVRQNP